GELAGVLVRAHGAQAGHGDTAPGAAQRPGEPEGVLRLALLLPPREPQLLPFPQPLPGLDEVTQRPLEVPERLLIAALGVLRPPPQARVNLLLRVPQPVQLSGGVPLPLGRIAFPAPGQAPVPREPGGPRVRAKHPLLRRGRRQREPVRPFHHHRQPPPAALRPMGTCYRLLLTFSRSHESVV